MRSVRRARFAADRSPTAPTRVLTSISPWPSSASSSQSRRSSGPCRSPARWRAAASELLVSEPVFGLDVIREIVEENPRLLEHLPQLAEKTATRLVEAPPRRAPAVLFPAFFDVPARYLGHAAWRYMQWTRRNRPEA